MAVIAFTTYSSNHDCSRTNNYIADGHGSPPAARTNRYLCDGHGGITQGVGHNCPSNSVLATSFMEAIRWNYERQHSFSEDRKKGHVTHVQLYISPTEDDRVPAEERMEMTKELIERTVLRDFPSIYIAHDNTDVGHCHISLCPYSMDGSHKLCMNNKLLYHLRREMDRICVEHGYSIIECPELWSDKEYREWFLQVKEEGRITVHPPKDADNPFCKQPHKRAWDFVRSKKAQIKRKEEREVYFKEITSSYSPEKERYFYISPYLYNPQDPGQPLRIRKITLDGKERSDLELQAAGLGAWAYHCGKKLEKKKIPGTDGLQKRMEIICTRAYEAKFLFESLDIRTQEELVLHLRHCGQDIGSLKRIIGKQEAVLREFKTQMDAVERWENEGDEDAFAVLKEYNCDTPEQVEKLKKEYTQILARKENYILLLEERSKEYRDLKAAEKVLDPTSSKEAWENYLEMLFSKSKIQKAKQISFEALERSIYELGELLGIPDKTMDRYVMEAEEYATYLRRNEEGRPLFREYRKRIFTAKETESQGYQNYCEEMTAIQDLWDMRHKMMGFGLLGFLLSVLIETWAEMQQSISRFELGMSLWLARLEKFRADQFHKKHAEIISSCLEVKKIIPRENQEIANQIQKMIDEIVNSRKDNNREKRIRSDPGKKESEHEKE